VGWGNRHRGSLHRGKVSSFRRQLLLLSFTTRVSVELFPQTNLLFIFYTAGPPTRGWWRQRVQPWVFQRSQGLASILTTTNLLPFTLVLLPMEVLVVVPALLPPLASTSPSPRSRPILRALQRQQLVSLSDSAVAHLEELRELQERWRSDWNRAAASKAGTGGRLSFVLDWNEIDRRRVFVFERCWPTGSHGSGVQDHIQGLGIGARRAAASTADFKTPR
jgi:hypothetical protein